MTVADNLYTKGSTATLFPVMLFEHHVFIYWNRIYFHGVIISRIIIFCLVCWHKVLLKLYMAYMKIDYILYKSSGLTLYRFCVTGLSEK